MALSIILLPSELKRLVVEALELSSGSADSLAALARSHTTYKREAERALYETLYIYTFISNSFKCMETLATDSEKAALVRFLTIEYELYDIDKYRKMMTYLPRCLINMHFLSHLRVRSWPNEAGSEMMEGLGKILCGGHFRLQTLYCHWRAVLNISQIIRNQTELQILGLYTNYRSPSLSTIIKTLKELHNAQLLFPIVLTLEMCDNITVADRMGIFPAVYFVDRRATIPQVLAQSFSKDQHYHMVTKAEDVTELSISMIDPSDMPSIYALAKDMAVSFLLIEWVYLWFERPCEIPSEEIKEELYFFSDLLRVLNICQC